jgi:signal peptidase I
VVTFLYPKDKKRIYIKRIIGMPGEEIAITNNQVFINNSRFSDKHGAFAESRNGTDRYLGTSFGPMQIPKNHYFLLGDNRDNSLDSRHFGPVEKDSILGKALVIYGSTPDDSLENAKRERTGRIIE